MKQKAICFLAVSPSRLFFNFCDSLVNQTYDVYVCVDKPFDANFDSLCKIIQIPNNVAEEAGFKGSVLYFNNKACSRDKALYYFCCIHKPQYEMIWFIEEDVFIPSVETIPNIDQKYPSGDLLSPSHYIFKKKNFFEANTWHWNHIFNQTPLKHPFAASMICAIRVSWKLINTIRRYVQLYKSLFLDEVLFNTLALKAGLQVIVAKDELHYTILHKYPWEKYKSLPTAYLYHPIKDVGTQFKLREK